MKQFFRLLLSVWCVVALTSCDMSLLEDFLPDNDNQTETPNNPNDKPTNEPITPGEICAIPQSLLNQWDYGLSNGKAYIVASFSSEMQQTVYMLNNSDDSDKGFYFITNAEHQLIGCGTTTEWYSITEQENGFLLSWVDDEGNLCGEFIEYNNADNQTRSNNKSEEGIWGPIDKICSIAQYIEHAYNIHTDIINRDYVELAIDIGKLTKDIAVDILVKDPRIKVALFVGEKIWGAMESQKYERQRAAMYGDCTIHIDEVSIDEQGALNVYVTLSGANTVPTHLYHLYYTEPEEVARNTVSYGVVGRLKHSPITTAWTEPYKVEHLLDRSVQSQQLMYTFARPTEEGVYYFRAYLSSTRFANSNGHVNNNHITYSNEVRFNATFNATITSFEQLSSREQGDKVIFSCRARGQIDEEVMPISWFLYYRAPGDTFTTSVSAESDIPTEGPSIGSANEADFSFNISIDKSRLTDGYANIELGIRGIFADGTRDTEPQIFEVHHDDLREMLIKFYHDTGGDNWTRNDNWCSDQPIHTWYGVDYNGEGYIQLYLSNNNLTGSGDLSDCTALEGLECENNQLTSLNISGCTALTYLDCGGYQLTSLDVSGCTALTYLAYYNYQLTSLNVSGCTALKELYCHYNQLTSLDVSGCTALEWLVCEDNQLTSLNVSGCTALRYLFCRNNPITQEIAWVTAMAAFSYDRRYEYYNDWTNGELVRKWKYRYPDGHGWYYPGEPGRGYH